MKEDEWRHSTDCKAITHRIMSINKMHHRVLEMNLENIGIHRASHWVLMTLADNEFASQKELAKRLEISPASVAVTLKNLEKSGYIKKTAKKEDNRINFVELTEKGRQLVEESREFFDNLDNETYHGFSEEERRELSGYLNRIYDNITQMKKSIRHKK